MKTLLFIGIILISSLGFTQELNDTTFDFWIGDWELTWDKPDSSKGHGTNRIVKILDTKVIQENFEDPETGAKGMSLSLYSSQTKQWHQAWVDNQGGYYDFIGAINDGQPIFKTKVIIQGDKKIIQRMVFKDITKNKFTWDWEITEDNGKNWKLQWRIYYTRKL